MRQPLEFKNRDLTKVAENADMLFAWIEEELPRTEIEEHRHPIPSHLALVTTTIMASGVPLLLGPILPGMVCWAGGGGGGCSG